MSDPSKPTVVVTHWIHPEVTQALAQFARPVAPAERDVMSRDRVLTELADAAAVLVCMADHVDERFLESGPRLRIISATLKGHDNVDVAACTQRGIWLTVLPDELTASTAELALGLMLGILRRVGEGDHHVRSGAHTGWRPRFYGTSLAGCTVGIIGMGAVGRALAAHLPPFGARVVYTDRAPLPAERTEALGARRLALAELLATSDIVVPLVPLTSATMRMIDAAAVAQMPPGAYVVNIGRGSVIDENAVADALESGHLAGYAADVFAMEDWAVTDRPTKICPRLLRHPRTLFTPHLGTAVADVRRHMSLTAVEQARQALAGQHPTYAINHVPT